MNRMVKLALPVALLLILSSAVFAQPGQGLRGPGAGDGIPGPPAAPGFDGPRGPHGMMDFERFFELGLSDKQMKKIMLGVMGVVMLAALSGAGAEDQAGAATTKSVKKLERGWFWKAGARAKTAEQALQLMTTAISRNSNFLLNVGPDRKGTIIASSLKTLAEIGKLHAS